MNIWLMTPGEPHSLWDSAHNSNPCHASSLARTLKDRGHHVSWWVPQKKAQQKFFSKTSSTQHVLHGDINLCDIDQFEDTSGFLFKNMFNRLHMRRRLRRRSHLLKSPDLIVSTLPITELAYEAARYSAIYSTPLIIDVRHRHDTTLPLDKNRPKRWMHKLQLLAHDRMERMILNHAHGLIASSEKNLHWGLEKAKRPMNESDSIIPLGYSNLKHHPFSTQTVHKLQWMGVDFNRPLVWYLGAFEKDIDLEPLIKVASVLQLTHPDVQLILSGYGEDESHYRDLARNLSNIIWTGWMSPDEIALLGSKAIVGVAPYRISGLETPPAMIFEYMSLGLPILSSLKGETQQMLDNHKIGLTYHGGDAESCLTRLKEILDNPFLQKMFSNNARALFDARYDAESVYTQYAHHLEFFELKRSHSA